MNPSDGSPEERFNAIVNAFAGYPDVTPPPDEPGATKKFGAGALKVRSKIFAMLNGDRLVVKLPRRRVDEMVASGEGERFDPGHGRVMKEWVAVEATSTQDWMMLAKEAMAFVGAAR